MLSAKAFAKINWDLRILGRRADNFHELDSVFVNIGLSDDLTFEPASGITLTCSDASLPVDDSNLIMKAARFLADEACNESSRPRPGAKIHLIKNIPMGGGMGGGSSDAACALRSLNALWNLNWSVERLSRIAAQLGSDVAYFLQGGWCLCRGRGEIVEPLFEAAPSNEKILLILPPLHVATPSVYKALKYPIWDGTGGRSVQDCAAVVRSFVARNDLTPAALQVEPRLADVQSMLQQFFPNRWLMSGSGAAHFVVRSAGYDKAALDAALNAAVPGTRIVETETLTPEK